MPEVTIREIRPEDSPLLEEFLYLVASCVSLPQRDARELHGLLHQLLKDEGTRSCPASPA